MKQLGYVTYHRATGVIKRISLEHPALPMRPKAPEQKLRAYVSPALEAHLRAWWGGVRAAGKLVCRGMEIGFDYTGSPDKPELVHVGALAEMASRTFSRGISKSEMGWWLDRMGMERVQKHVCRRNKRGRVTYGTTRTFYRIG